MASTAQLYAVSRATLYRLLREDRRPKDAYRSDRGSTRAMPADEIERLCEIVAAMKIRTTNRKGRHLSTVRVLELLEKRGAGYSPPSIGTLAALAIAVNHPRVR